MHYWVRGQWVPFDGDAINQFLGHPLISEEGQQCEYSQRRSQALGFDEEAIDQLLCVPGQVFSQTTTMIKVQIMHTSMTTFTQIWMTFLLSNILPNDHSSDLPLPKCQLVSAILTQVSVHVAQLISDAIYQFAGVTPPRHPVNPEKSNRALGFPTLITCLYQFYGVSVTPTKLIRPLINKAFIVKYCMPRQVQGQAQQQPKEDQQQPAADAPPPPLQEEHSLRSISDHLRRLELQMHRYIHHVTSQQAANHRGQVRLNETFYWHHMHQQSQDPNPFPWPTPEEFEATVAWLEDETNFETQAGPAGALGGDGEDQKDDDMVDMLDFFT